MPCSEVATSLRADSEREKENARAVEEEMVRYRQEKEDLEEKIDALATTIEVRAHAAHPASCRPAPLRICLHARSRGSEGTAARPPTLHPRQTAQSRLLRSKRKSPATF